MMYIINIIFILCLILLIYILRISYNYNHTLGLIVVTLFTLFSFCILLYPLPHFINNLKNTFTLVECITLFIGFLSASIIICSLIIHLYYVLRYLFNQSISYIDRKILSWYIKNPVLFRFFAQTSFWIFSSIIVIFLFRITEYFSFFFHPTEAIPLENTIKMDVGLKEQGVDSKPNDMSLNESTNHEGFWTRNKDKIILFSLGIISIVLFIYGMKYTSSSVHPSKIEVDIETFMKNYETSVKTFIENYERSVESLIITREQVLNVIQNGEYTSELNYLLRAKETLIFVKEYIPLAYWESMKSMETYYDFIGLLQFMLSSDTFTLQQKHSLIMLINGIKTLYFWGIASDLTIDHSISFWIRYKDYIDNILSQYGHIIM